MSSTLAAVRKAVRRWSRDENLSDTAHGTRLLNRMIEDETRSAAASIPVNTQLWQSAYISLTANLDPPDVNITSASAEFGQVLSIRRNSDKYPLRKVSQEEMTLLRAGSIASGTQPAAYALLEDTSQNLYVQFDVVVTTTRTFDALYNLIPAAFADVDTVAIPFERNFLAGFEQGIAAKAMRAMSEGQKEARGITPDYIAALEAAYAKALRDAQIRAWRLKQPRRSYQGSY